MRHVEHEIVTAAPPETVFRLLVDVERWPQLFKPTVHVATLERNGSKERLQLWATANDDVRTWTSVRQIDAAALRIAFHQDQPATPIASMAGQWQISKTADGGARVVLTHHYSVIDDDPEVTSWLAAAIETNSTQELAALREASTGDLAGDGLTFSFSDSIRISGQGESAYQFLYEAGAWPERLPHVARLDLQETTPGLQTLDMDTRSPDGGIHRTRSVRVCFPNERIFYKQTQVPALLSAHTGLWQLDPTDGDVVATSQHTVVLKASAIPEVLGSDATVADAREFVRSALGGNSRTTLQHAKAFAESGHRA
jgi:aromatase